MGKCAEMEPSKLYELVQHPQLGPRTLHAVPLRDVVANLRHVSVETQTVVEDTLVEAYIQEKVQNLAHLWRLHEHRPHYWIAENSGGRRPPGTKVRCLTL